jgi:hypothetical protein
MSLRERYLEMMNNQYDDEIDYDDEIIDIEGAKRRKKRKTKKGGCCGAGMEGGASYQKMIHTIAVHNRKPGTKKYDVGVGSTKTAVTKAYNKIKGKRGGVIAARQKDLMETYKLIMESYPFNEVENNKRFQRILKNWPLADQEDILNNIITGKIKTTQQFKRYIDENAPLKDVLEEPFEDDVESRNIRCNYNAETMSLCRRISKLEREFERKYKKVVDPSAFL